MLKLQKHLNVTSPDWGKISLSHWGKLKKGTMHCTSCFHLILKLKF